jgi:hypothetical protein
MRRNYAGESAEALASQGPISLVGKPALTTAVG